METKVLATVGGLNANERVGRDELDFGGGGGVDKQVGLLNSLTLKKKQTGKKINYMVEI